jgi:rubrerythrin
MTVIFSIREIAEAAVEKEKKRREFYTTVCELCTDKNMKALFQFLKEEEDRHVETFEKIRDGLPVESQPAEYDDDMNAYMDSVIDDRLYSKVGSKEFVQNALNAKEVFQLAIGFEKDAILYFREFLPFLADVDKKLVEDLIDQEKGHIRKLAECQKQSNQRNP